MDRAQAEQNRAVAVAAADGGALPRTGPLSPWMLAGYLSVAAPVTAACAGVLDGPWASGFAYAVLLLGTGFIWGAMLPPRPLERVSAAEEDDRAAANAGADCHHKAKAKVMMAWCGYLLVAAPTMGICAGLLDVPWAAGFAYATLLLGVVSICSAVLPLPPRRTDRAQAPHERGAVVDAAAGGNHQDQDAAIPNANAAIARCGYILVAAAVSGLCAGLAHDTPGAAAVFGYALLLLGFGFIALAVLPLRPMERVLEDENRRTVGMRNGDRGGGEAVGGRGGAGNMAMDWTGYFVVAATVVASWAGFVEGPAASFFAFALLLLGIAFVVMAMLAVAKPKMA